MSDPALSPAPVQEAKPAPTPSKIFRVFFGIGITSFGGGLVAYLQDEIVGKQKWMTEDDFLAALEIGQTLPGLNSANVAIIAGRKLAGPRGSLAALLGLVLPGAVILCILGVLYERFHKNPDVAAALAGIAAAAVGLLLQVTLKIGKKQFLRPLDLFFVIVTFVLSGILHVSLVAVLFIVAPLAIMLYRPRNNKAPTP